MEIFSAYNPPPKVQLECKDPSRAVQSEKGSADVNVIVARYTKTGMLPMSSLPALYLDVSELGDYRSVRDQVNYAERVFASLPAEIRARFENDPAVFLDFTSDPANRGQLQELGLLARDPEPEVRPPDPVVPPA